jgi:hypothetical protein
MGRLLRPELVTGLLSAKADELADLTPLVDLVVPPDAKELVRRGRGGGGVCRAWLRVGTPTQPGVRVMPMPAWPAARTLAATDARRRTRSRPRWTWALRARCTSELRTSPSGSWLRLMLAWTCPAWRQRTPRTARQPRQRWWRPTAQVRRAYTLVLACRRRR